MNFKILLSLKRETQFRLNISQPQNNKQVNQRKILNKFIDRPVNIILLLINFRSLDLFVP